MKKQLTHLKLTSFASILLIPCAFFSLVSCESGSGDGENFIAPQSMSGITFDIVSLSGPSFSFVAGRGQEDDGIEEGVIVEYEKASSEGFLFPGTNFIFDGELVPEVTGHPVKWPDEFNNGQYRYTSVGESSGRLEIWGTGISTEFTEITVGGDGFFTFVVFAEIFLADLTSSDPVTFDINFRSPSGGFIDGVDMVMTTPRTTPIDPLVGIEEQELTLVGDITFTNGGRVNAGYDTDYEGFSQIFDGDLDGHQLVLVDDLTGTRSIYLFTTAFIGNGFDPDIFDQGTMTLTYDRLSDQTDQNDINSGEYQVFNQEGTDIFFVDMQFDGTTGPGSDLSSEEILDGRVRLDFTNGTFTRPFFDTLNNTETTVSGTFAIVDIRG